MSRLVNARLERAVRERATHRCEYCHLPQAFSNFKHVADHIVPLKHHGPTALENLAWCCAACNRYKGPNLSGVDASSGTVALLFDPRRQRWQDHFEWRGVLLLGLTGVGRATVDVLAVNHPSRVAARLAMAREGRLPREFE